MKRWKIRLLGIAVFILLLILTLQFCSPQIQANLQNKTTRALQEKQLNWAKVSVDGRHITLNGSAPTEALRSEAEQTVQALWGPVDIDSQITVTDSVSPYAMDVEFDGEQLSISGYVSDQPTYNHMTETLQTAFGKDKVTVNLAFAGGQPAHWGMVSTDIIEHLNQLDYANLQIRDRVISLRGHTHSIEKKTQLSQHLSSYRERGYDLELDISAPPPAPTCLERFNQTLSAEGIQFFSNDTTVVTKSHPLLKQLSNIAKACPQAQITIAGHTDNIGDTAFNEKLSHERAIAVSQHLIQSGIDSSRLKTIGFGESKPVASNNTFKGKSANRRIEFIIEGIEED